MLVASLVEVLRVAFEGTMAKKIESRLFLKENYMRFANEMDFLRSRRLPHVVSAVSVSL